MSHMNFFKNGTLHFKPLFCVCLVFCQMYMRKRKMSHAKSKMLFGKVVYWPHFEIPVMPNNTLKGVRFAHWTAKAPQAAVHALRAFSHGSSLRFSCPLACR